MSYARVWHTVSTLLNGKVLVTGGDNGVGSQNTAELYDPSTGTWSTTASMTDIRVWHTASVLKNGKVLVAGGTTSGIYTLNTAELYDPSTETWTTIRNMSSPRTQHTATVLKDGQVLIAGGSPGMDMLNTTAHGKIFQPIPRSTAVYSMKAFSGLIAPRESDLLLGL
jgi:N-acetylneuraminic acid mutarotase